MLIFILCLNFAAGLVMDTALALPGATYSTPMSGTSNMTEYQEQFNATETAKKWRGPTTYGIAIFGDIWSGLDFLMTKISYLFAGFPMMLGWIGNCYITDPAMRAAWNVITAVLIALFSVMTFIFIIEFISGRRLPD